MLVVSVIAFAQPKVGDNATEITLNGINGKPVSLTSFKGKVVLIDFWASWCKPCRKTFPQLKSTYDAYKKKGFEIYSVSVDMDAADWKAAVNSDKLNWVLVNDVTGDIALKWDVNYIPSSFLLDKEGKIVAINPSHEELKTLLNKML